MLKLTLTGYLLLCCLLHTIAQDANYWYSSYGPGGFLSPGAVIANNKDSGVLSYNPALLGYNTKNAASINGTIYQWEKTNLINAVGPDHSLKYSTGSVIPQMISNTVYMKLKRPITVAYALTHTPVMNFESTQRRDETINVLDDSYSPGNESYVGQYSTQRNINITSGILSVGTMLTSKLAVGFSVEGQIRKQYYNVNYSSRAIINDTSLIAFARVASSENNYIISNNHFGVLFKAGIAYDLAPEHHLGLLITSPLVRLGGKATLFSDILISNVKDGTVEYNLLANTRQTGLKTKWKMPLSIAAGYSYDYSKGQLYFATEYFLRVKEYNVVTPQNSYYIRPDTANNSGTSLLVKFKDARKDVMNFAIGISYYLKPSVTLFGSLRTDFSYADKNLFADQFGYVAYTSYWSNYHLQAGGNIKKRKFNMRVGLLLSYGRTSHYQQEISFNDPKDTNLLLGSVGETDAYRFSAGITFSYIHNF
ncbi:MAG: hypothetical protein QM731_21355 [Chitinophagaceae bacterium]